MRVKVNLLGGLRHFHAGEETVEMDLDPAVTPRQIFPLVKIPPGEVFQVLIHDRPKKFDDPIGLCEEINILPILAGG